MYRSVPAALLAAVMTLATGAFAGAASGSTLPQGSARMQGMTEAGYTADVFDSTGVTGEIARLKADGVNWLSIQVAWYQQNNTSTVIAPSATQTPTDASVTNLINLAHQAGMRVFLDPFINSEVGSGWQALFHPSNVAAWFQSFDNYIRHYAELAQADHADLLAIGDEFDSLDTNPAYTASWDQAVTVARTYYTGPITYGADYTNYQHVTFWDALDEVGVDAYFPLSQSADPTVAELAASWNREADAIQAWRRSSGLTSKPFLITELGYPSENGAAANPGAWSPRQPVNLALQQKLYEATFESIWQRPWLAGIMWFWWANPSNPNWRGGPNDNGYTPRGKPAEATLAHYFDATTNGGSSATAGSGANGGSSTGGGSTGVGTTTNGGSGATVGSGASGGSGTSGGSGGTSGAGTSTSARGAGPLLVGLAAGDGGTAVYTLQADLRLLGFTDVALTGVYDPATSAAVSEFETWAGLPTSSPTTVAFRDAVLAQLREPRPLLVGVGPGESGRTVYTLQADLRLLGYTGVALTGVYDAATEAAVAAFETSENLPLVSTTTMAFRDAVLAGLRG